MKADTSRNLVFVHVKQIESRCSARTSILVYVQQDSISILSTYNAPNLDFVHIYSRRGLIAAFLIVYVGTCVEFSKVLRLSAQNLRNSYETTHPNAMH